VRPRGLVPPVVCAEYRGLKIEYVWCDVMRLATVAVLIACTMGVSCSVYLPWRESNGLSRVRDVIRADNAYMRGTGGVRAVKTHE
jgi:hypothetical protein